MTNGIRQDSGPVPLLQMEIGRLEEENNMLRRRLDKLEIDSVNALQVHLIQSLPQYQPLCKPPPPIMPLR